MIIEKAHSLSIWIISLVFLIAGLLKLIQPDNLIEVLLFFELFNYINSQFVVYTIAVIEIILSILLVFNYKTRFVKAVILLFTSSFLIISILGFLDNWQFACGCLGRFSFGKFDEMMIFRNTVLFGMSGWIFFYSRKKRNLEEGIINN